MLQRIKEILFGKSSAPTQDVRRAESARWREIEANIKARYDASLTTEENAKHWANVDYGSAKAANSYGIRRVLRGRAGYEIANNCYARGIVTRRAAYVVGRGPRLQCQFDRPEDNLQTQRAWNAWCVASGFTQTLRTCAVAKGGRDGEALGLFKTNERIANPVKLYLQGIEADQCGTPTGFTYDGLWVDGVELDSFGNPAVYHILKHHPGDVWANSEFDRVPARFVCHVFNKSRNGQVRGIPEITPGLDLFAQLRRWTAATLMAAEIAASYALFIKTNGTPEETDPIVAMSTEDIYRGMITAMPQGWEPFQAKAEQPTTTFGDFEHAILVQLCSALDIPFGIAIGDFSGSSYAGGRLDTQGFFKTVQIERGEWVDGFIEPTFNEWLVEASRIPGLLPDVARNQAFAMDRRFEAIVPHVWRWDAMPHIDIKKEVDAYAAAVNSNFITRQYVSSEVFGEEWNDVVAQRGKEGALEDKYGVQPFVPGAPSAPMDKIPDEEPDAALIEEGADA